MNPEIPHRTVSLRRSRRAGFTLIEVLAAMSILVIIVLSLSRMFNDGTKIWRLGTRQADTDGGTRAVISFLVRRLMTAVADPQIPFYLSNQGLQTYGVFSSELAFVSMNQNTRASSSSTYRSAEEFRFYVSFMKNQAKQDITARPLYRLALYNPQTTTAIKAYNLNQTAAAWYAALKSGGGEGLCDYVTKFQVYAQPHRLFGTTPLTTYDSNSFGNQLPLWIDVFIEVINQRDAPDLQLRTGNSTQVNEYLLRNARRYVARVSFMNHEGYSRGYDAPR